MKAAQINGYSKEIKLEWNDIPMPEVRDYDVLVKVKTAGVNPLDLLILRGSVKLIVDYQFPLTMGNELSGVVEAVGKRVTKFKVGDSVYTRLPEQRIGAFAEYAAVHEDAVAKMPSNLDYVEAAAVPLTALTAYQVLKEKFQAQPGEKIFISGGTGGLGAMAVPMAKHFGLYVITNGGQAGRQRMLDLGADEFLDYKKNDYSKRLSNIDYVLDTTKEIEKELGILKPHGKLVTLAGMPNYRFASEHHFPLWKKLMFGIAGSSLDRMARKQNKEYHFLFMRADGNQLEEITKFVELNNIKPSIDSTFEFKDINAALTKLDTGHSKGKVILTF
ncbi:NADP-dependent oxidoreductase [Clostridium akagii]|uniref:NADP-dependent oxidoreductase n=1 Tax=Clostridium akagii TaxID=91623 RepID=UPI0004789F87|nr:NADP-dependent oxidoreductase [Clostridium akagii]